MQTVQMQCGSCNRVMAISVEHLGSQVHCPHCQAVVEAPPPLTFQDQADHGEEVVSERTLAGADAMAQPLGADANHDMDQSPVPTWTDGLPSAGATAPSSPELGTLRQPRAAQARALAPILLIFLVPYAFLATAVIVYLLLNQGKLNQSRPFDPLERLPDPKPKDGGPRLQERVKHDSPLPDKLKTRFNQTLTLGAIQVTPLKVRHAHDGFVLHLKMKNVSKDLVFNPIAAEFLKTTGGNMPYTYLDWVGKNIKIYGGFPEWLRGPEGKKEPSRGDIGPGEEELVRIVTGGPKFKTEVERIARSQEHLVWRVQVRRGFVEVGGKQVSATAVVGVEFNARDIEPESRGG